MEKEKQQYQSKIKAQIEEWDSRIESLESKSRTKQGQDSRIQGPKSELELLREARETAQQKLELLREASEDEWDGLKKEMDESWDDIVSGVESKHERVEQRSS